MINFFKRKKYKVIFGNNNFIYIKAKNEKQALTKAVLNQPISYKSVVKVEEIVK